MLDVYFIVFLLLLLFVCFVVVWFPISLPIHLSIFPSIKQWLKWLMVARLAGWLASGIRGEAGEERKGKERRVGVFYVTI